MEDLVEEDLMEEDLVVVDLTVEDLTVEASMVADSTEQYGYAYLYLLCSCLGGVLQVRATDV